MFIYSVSIQIQKSVEQDWLIFMQEKHIADVLNTGCFTKAIMRKAVKDNDENTSKYNIEYHTDSCEKYETYVTLKAAAMQKDVTDRFAGKFTATREFYEVISEL